MISAVIPFADRSINALRAVCNQLLTGGIDEIVIANTGGVRTGLECESIREIHTPLNAWWPCIPRILGSNVARGDVIVFTLADCMVVKPEKLTAFCTLPESGVIRTAATCTVLCTKETRLALDGEMGFLGCSRSERHDDGFLIGALMAIRRDDLLNRMRNWDPEMRGWGYNDRDFLARAKQVGLKHEVFPIEMVHLHHQRLSTGTHPAGERMSKDKQMRDWWGYTTKTRRMKMDGKGLTIVVPDWAVPMDWHPIPAGEFIPDDLTGEFDLVHMVGSLSFYTRADAAKVLQQARKALKPGGHITVAQSDLSKMLNFKGSEGETCHRILGILAPRKSFWTGEEIKDALLEAGFSAPDGSIDDYPIGTTSRFTTTVRGVNPRPAMATKPADDAPVKPEKVVRPAKRGKRRSK